jgi:hypothetical protein
VPSYAPLLGDQRHEATGLGYLDGGALAGDAHADDDEIVVRVVGQARRAR